MTDTIKRNRVENTEATETSNKRQRIGTRKFHTQEGPLGFLQNLSIPGYRLYLAVDSYHGRIEKLTSDPSIGYEFVSPAEVGLTQINGQALTGDKVSLSVGGGKIGYLLKIPEEWYEDDRKAKDKLSNDGIYLDAIKSDDLDKKGQIYEGKKNVKINRLS